MAVALAMLCLTGCASKRVEPQWVYFPPPPATPHVVHLASFNSLGELVPPHVTMRDLFRGTPPSPYVQKPAGVDYQDGHLYICDTGLNVVHDWNLATGASRRIGQRGDGTLQKPVDVAISANGMIFVADTERQEVVEFTSLGAFAGRLCPSDKGEYRPTSIAVRDEEGASFLAVSDAISHDVGTFALADMDLFRQIRKGEYIPLIRDMSDETAKPYYPSGVAIHVQPHAGDKELVLLISDALSARILRYAANKEVVHTISQPGDRYGDLGQPKHLDIGPDGVIFVADAAFRCVHLFNQEGQLLMLLGGPEDKPGGTPMPLGVTVAESLPENLHRLVPPDFNAHYFLFVTNTIGAKRISLYAVGLPQE